MQVEKKKTNNPAYMVLFTLVCVTLSNSIYDLPYEDLKFKSRHLHDNGKARKGDFIITRYFTMFLL